MEKIEWKDSYLIGVAVIDYQHKKLFELVNLFIETLDTPKCQSLVGPILMGLMTYTKSHFSAEEAEMQKVDFPELQPHRLLHEQLRHEVETLAERWKNGESLDQIGLVPLLKEWLTRHIQVEDKKIGVFLERQRLCGHIAERNTYEPV